MSDLVAVRDDVVVEAVGPQWVAYSPASGETVFLNDSAAALIEVLAERPRSLEDAAEVLAEATQTVASEILPLLEDAAADLDAAGLTLSGGLA